MKYIDHGGQITQAKLNAIPVQRQQTFCASPEALWSPVSHPLVSGESSAERPAVHPAIPPPGQRERPQKIQLQSPDIKKKRKKCSSPVRKRESNGN